LKQESSYESEDEAREALDSFIIATNDFKDELSNIQDLMSYYTNQLTLADRAEQDILHKIELENIVGIQAVRLVKQIKEIRIKRREAKDNIKYLTNVNLATSNLIETLHAHEDYLENRSYAPRVLY
jgi:hypothetical protein